MRSAALLVVAVLAWAPAAAQPRPAPPGRPAPASQPKAPAKPAVRPPATPPPRGAATPKAPVTAPRRLFFAAEWPEGEARHLANVRQLTTLGRNSEASFSRDGKRIIFQSVRGESPYAQIYTMNPDGSGQKLVSSGRGKATCARFAPTRRKLLYAATHADPKAPGPTRDLAVTPRPAGWDFDPALDLFEADLDGRSPRRLTATLGYDAEAAYSPDGKRIVFTSQRDGDLDLYVMNVDGKEVRRLTTAPGYDGGAAFSPDGREVVFRAFRGPGRSAEIFLIGADGKNERQLTSWGFVSWGPAFHPDGRRLIFASNPAGLTNFELYLMRRDGTAVERVTYTDGFDGVPAFSPDGKKLLWTSTRGGGVSQVWVADWID